MFSAHNSPPGGYTILPPGSPTWGPGPPAPYFVHAPQPPSPQFQPLQSFGSVFAATQLPSNPAHSPQSPFRPAFFLENALGRDQESREGSLKSLAVALQTISILGIVAHVFFAVFTFFDGIELSLSVLIIAGGLGACVLTFVALRYAQRVMCGARFALLVAGCGSGASGAYWLLGGHPGIAVIMIAQALLSGVGTIYGQNFFGGERARKHADHHSQYGYAESFLSDRIGQ